MRITQYDQLSVFWMFSLLWNEITYIFLFAITTAGVVPSGGRKMFPCTPSILQIIHVFYFWYFEISGNILIKIIVMFRTIFSTAFCFFWPSFRIEMLWLAWLPWVKFSKFQYNRLAFIASLLWVTDEDSLSEIVQYDGPLSVLWKFSLLSKELNFIF